MSDGSWHSRLDRRLVPYERGVEMRKVRDFRITDWIRVMAIYITLMVVYIMGEDSGNAILPIAFIVIIATLIYDAYYLNNKEKFMFPIDKVTRWGEVSRDLTCPECGWRVAGKCIKRFEDENKIQVWWRCAKCGREIKLIRECPMYATKKEFKEFGILISDKEASYQRHCTKEYKAINKRK